jgi:hypothetical protein
MNYSIDAYSMVEGELASLGIDGDFILELQTIIKTQEDLEDFKNFIILNEGQYETQLELIHLYKQHKFETMVYSAEEFFVDYHNCKKTALEKLFCRHINQPLLNKVSKIINEANFKLEDFYRVVVKYRKNYNIVNIIKKIEADYINN